MATAKNITITLPLKKETKNMLQFQATEETKATAIIPTLYIAKSVFPDGFPEALEVSVKAAKL